MCDAIFNGRTVQKQQLHENCMDLQLHTVPT